MSESDDCDDVFSESSKEPCESPGDPSSCQLLSRKKRRGIIEKRRRDRINSSLTELRRLVPSAYEKQGSAKLEKAEILQLAVDHIKMLHAKVGVDSLTCDSHKLAMDYHILGFRECASEVSRYLVTVEGLDLQDPLRLRLMSHLQCFAAQRELSKKTPSMAPWGYSSTASQQPGIYPPDGLAHYDAAPPPPPPPPPPATTSGTSSGLMSYPPPQYQGPYDHPPGTSASSQVKPYRPWGAELAY